MDIHPKQGQEGQTIKPAHRELFCLPLPENIKKDGDEKIAECFGADFNAIGDKGDEEKGEREGKGEAGCTLRYPKKNQKSRDADKNEKNRYPVKTGNPVDKEKNNAACPMMVEKRITGVGI